MKDLAMHREHEVIEEIPGLYRIVGLHPLRRTRGVAFDCLPMGIVPRIDALDRVIHETSALSPGPVGDVEKPWYMHPHQDDNLMVMYGTRMVDLYKKGHGKLESFVVTSDRIERIGGFVHNGPAMLVWPRAVFHRVQSGKEGSASINANRYVVPETS